MLKTLMPSLNELVNYSYTSIKTAETEQLISQSLSSLKPAKTPELLQVSGIPGAGKSSFCSQHSKAGYLFLSFDKIMTSMQGYKKTLHEKGAEEAYRLYEMPARVIGYELLRRATDMRLNIMLEHSGTNNAHLELFQNISKLGYKTAVDFIICDVDTAIKRAQKRQAEINRYIPESVIRERDTKFRTYIAAYQKITKSVSFYDGTDNFSLLKKI